VCGAVFLRTVEQGSLFNHPQIVMREVEARLNSEVVKLEEGDGMALIFWRKSFKVDPDLMSSVRESCSVGGRNVLIFMLNKGTSGITRDDKTRLGAIGIHEVIEMYFDEGSFDLSKNMPAINHLVAWMLAG